MKKTEFTEVQLVTNDSTKNLYLEKENEKIELEKMISEFLSIIDFKLCSFEGNSITIEDEKNKDELNKVLILPIDFESKDGLRVFKCGKLASDGYNIGVSNTKYPKIPFSKNGISAFDIKFRKGLSTVSNEDNFLAEIFYNNNFYVVCMGNASDNSYFGYRIFGDNEFVDINYSFNPGNRKLDICSRILPRNVKQICINEEINEDKHVAVLEFKDNGEEVYKQDISLDDLEFYFKALSYKVIGLIDQANNGLKTLNANVYEMVFDYYDFVGKFLNSGNNVTSNQVIDDLFEKYFSDIIAKNGESLNKVIPDAAKEKHLLKLEK